jgi:hypothetical protein
MGIMLGRFSNYRAKLSAMSQEGKRRLILILLAIAGLIAFWLDRPPVSSERDPNVAAQHEPRPPRYTKR